MIEEYTGGNLEDHLVQARVKLEDDASGSPSLSHFDGFVCPGLYEESQDLAKLRELGVDIASMIQMGIDIMQGLAYLHSRTPAIMHRDIKPSNIFFDSNRNAKLGDFGFSKRVQSTGKCAPDGPVGTYRYMAPEVVLGNAYDISADIYSTGVVLLYAFTGR